MTDQPNQRRVLFVEDEPALRISYERFFRPRYAMAFASSGAEALARLAEESPDVVVLDMRLPGTGPHEAGQEAEQRRLAGAVRPRHGEHFPRAHVEVHPAQDLQRPERADEAPRREEGWINRLGQWRRRARRGRRA